MRRTTAFAAMVLLVLAFVAIAPGSAAATPSPSLMIGVERPGDSWSASGAITDSGTFADDRVVFNKGFTYHAFRTFTGSNGAFVARADARIVPTGQPGVFDVTGRWAVIGGTGDYAELHGRGMISETFDAAAGTVAGTWAGVVHFD